MKKTLLFLFLTTSISLFAQSFSTGTQTLLSGLTANINIDADTEITTLTLTGPSNAWFAIGFGNLDMGGTDVFRTNGSTIVDAYSNELEKDRIEIEEIIYDKGEELSSQSYEFTRTR